MQQGEPFVVGWVPGVVVGGEGEALFVVGLVGEQGPAFAAVLADFFPEDVPDAGCGGAEEHAGGYLQEPSGEETAKPCGAVGEDDDGHQMGSSLVIAGVSGTGGAEGTGV